ncbi:unnamed protein product [Protopolystoma xenopodis]|uniref:Uncharacterized protein n=1 Tax=Protopolystoma xenopodis TaxID=117903 RepID=A0A448XHD7_9PLAT|nr:unnamed protein product [Protopolystoma xenopodis]
MLSCLGAAWSPTRASVFYLTRSDGSVEVWDLLDKTNEPIMGQSVSSVSLTAIALWTTPKKQLLAVGDANGALQILIVPQRLRKMGPNDYSNLTAYIGREIKRREYVLMRWALREQERVEKENEAKLKAGISVHVQMTDDEILAREQVRQLLRSAHLVFPPTRLVYSLTLLYPQKSYNT